MADISRKRNRRSGEDEPEVQLEDEQSGLPGAEGFGTDAQSNQDASELDFTLPDLEDEDFGIDLSDPKVTGVIPEGTYPAYVADLQKGESQKGDKMWTWYFTPLTDVSVNTLRLFTVLTPTAAWKLIETLTALGLGEVGKVTAFKRTDALYRMCLVEIIHEEYPKNSGQMRPSVARVLPHPDGKGKKFQPFSGVPIPGDVTA